MSGLQRTVLSFINDDEGTDDEVIPPTPISREGSSILSTGEGVNSLERVDSQGSTDGDQINYANRYPAMVTGIAVSENTPSPEETETLTKSLQAFFQCPNLILSGAKNGRVYLSFPSEQAFLLAKIKDGQMCGTDRINIHSWKQDERNKYNARQKREQRSARSADGGRGGPRQAGGQGNGGKYQNKKNNRNYNNNNNIPADDDDGEWQTQGKNKNKKTNQSNHNQNNHSQNSGPYNHRGNDGGRDHGRDFSFFHSKKRDDGDRSHGRRNYNTNRDRDDFKPSKPSSHGEKLEKSTSASSTDGGAGGETEAPQRKRFIVDASVLKKALTGDDTEGNGTIQEKNTAPSNIFGGGKAQDIRLFESKKQLEQEKKEQEALSKEASSTDKNDKDDKEKDKETGDEDPNDAKENVVNEGNSDEETEKVATKVSSMKVDETSGKREYPRRTTYNDGRRNGGRRSGRGGDPYQGTGGRGGRNNWRKDGHRKGRGDDKHSRRRKKEEEVVEEQPNFAKNTYALLDIDDDNSD